MQGQTGAPRAGTNWVLDGVKTERRQRQTTQQKHNAGEEKGTNAAKNRRRAKKRAQESRRELVKSGGEESRGRAHCRCRASAVAPTHDHGFVTLLRAECGATYMNAHSCSNS